MRRLRGVDASGPVCVVCGRSGGVGLWPFAVGCLTVAQILTFKVMTPTDFPEKTTTLAAPAGMPDCLPLHVHRKDGVLISCWQGDEKDRQRFLQTGKLFLHVYGGMTQPPVYVGTESPFQDDAFEGGLPGVSLIAEEKKPSPIVLMETVERTLKMFPEVKWDRWAGDPADHISVFGWMPIEGTPRFDFVFLLIGVDGPWLISTSSPQYSAEFSRRCGFGSHTDCHRVEDFFPTVRSIKLVRQVPFFEGGGVFEEPAEPDKIPSWGQLAADLAAQKKEEAPEWMVFSTAIKQGWLMLYCDKTGRTGSVRDPSKEEWEAAFYAPSAPYRWHDDSRVVVDPE